MTKTKTQPAVPTIDEVREAYESARNNWTKCYWYAETVNLRLPLQNMTADEASQRGNAASQLAKEIDQRLATIDWKADLDYSKAVAKRFRAAQRWLAGLAAERLMKKAGIAFRPIGYPLSALGDFSSLRINDRAVPLGELVLYLTAVSWDYTLAFGWLFDLENQAAECATTAERVVRLLATGNDCLRFAEAALGDLRTISTIVATFGVTTWDRFVRLARAHCEDVT